MSEHNQNPNNGNQNEGGGGGGNSLLSYYFLPRLNVAAFQVTNQHPAITRFLEQQPNRLWTASNGYRVGLGICYPEWKLSENTIFLDGTDGRRLKKIDTTRFPVDGKVYRDGQMRLVNNALEELVEVVKETFKDSLRVKPRRENVKVTLA